MASRCRPVRQRTSQPQAAGRGQRDGKSQQREAGLESRRQLGDVGGRLGRHAGLHARSTSTQMTRAQPLKNSSVNQSISARRCARRWAVRRPPARPGRAGPAAGSGRTIGVSAVVASDTSANHSGSATWRLHELAAPAPQGPQRQRPGRPGEPEHEAAQRPPVARRAAPFADAPVPECPSRRPAPLSRASASSEDRQRAAGSAAVHIGCGVVGRSS